MAHVHKAKPQHHIAGDGNILLFIIQEKMWFLAERASNNNSNDKTIAGVTRQLSRWLSWYATWTTMAQSRNTATALERAIIDQDLEYHNNGCRANNEVASQTIKSYVD